MIAKASKRSKYGRGLAVDIHLRIWEKLSQIEFSKECSAPNQTWCIPGQTWWYSWHEFNRVETVITLQNEPDENNVDLFLTWRFSTKIASQRDYCSVNKCENHIKQQKQILTAARTVHNTDRSVRCTEFQLLDAYEVCETRRCHAYRSELKTMNPMEYDALKTLITKSKWQHSVHQETKDTPKFITSKLCRSNAEVEHLVGYQYHWNRIWLN